MKLSLYSTCIVVGCNILQLPNDGRCNGCVSGFSNAVQGSKDQEPGEVFHERRYQHGHAPHEVADSQDPPVTNYLFFSLKFMLICDGHA